jgi:hypothetical protein
MIQSIKNRFNTYYTFIYKNIITINNNKRGAKKGSAYSKAKAALVMDDK